ncbi:MAG: amidohydrolase family protein [Acidobacteria bacterium]|nr:amidohydrolase family protein [Acidobacteriota bacterium]MYH21554.1 amidohydrolase family protein [Acidobacteriota bacterium]MYK80172.1 amidohydrolase family protein [Acidobacteriota bacterium]
MTNRLSHLAAVVVALALAIGTAAAQPTIPYLPGEDGVLPQPHVALANTHVVNVVDGTVLENAVVVVRDGLIESVGTEPPPEGAHVLDLGGRHLMPGLFDGHWHGRTLDGLYRALESGVTTMKSAAVGSFLDVRMNDMVEKGHIAGPEIFAAGVYVLPNLGQSALADPRLYKYLHNEVKGAEAVREVVQVDVDRGARWIKTRSGGTTSGPDGPDPKMLVYSVEELTAIVEEADALGVKVACHAHGREVVRNAIVAGCATIEHGSYVDEEGLRLMLEMGTAWVPTYTSVVGFLLPHDDYNSSASFQRGSHLLHYLQKGFRRALELGVTILTATDTQYGPNTNVRVYREMTHFVEMGMTPLQALQSATIRSAEVYGIRDRTGAIEVGLEADLVSVDGNPVEDIYATHEPMFVMSNGRIVFHRTVDPDHYIPRRVGVTGFGTGGPRP